MLTGPRVCMRAQTPNLPSQVRQGVSRQYRMRRHPADTTAAPTRPARTQHKDVAPDRQGKVAAAYELPDQAVSPAPMRKVVKQLSSLQTARRLPIRTNAR